MLQGIISAIFSALFGSILSYLKAKQADANLKALGYTEAQRDLAVKAIKESNAVAAARQRADADSLRGLPDPDARPWKPDAKG